ncbi:MAG: DNA gyrase inhibitor YacG [Methylovirgula sp.]
MSEAADQKNVAFTPRPCPICGKPSTVKDRPFCSKRCADIDLHHWLKGSYAIPAAPEAGEEEALPEGEARPQKDRD